MTTQLRLWLVMLAWVSGSLVSSADEPTPTFSAAAIEVFEKKVRPILAEHCFECHGAKKQESGLRLDGRASVLKGGDNGPIVDLKQVANSRLLLAVKRTGDLKMPPESTLQPQQIDVLQQWISAGLPWPQERTTSEQSIAEQARQHWAFQPVREVTVPKPTLKWGRTDIDAFIAEKLQAVGIIPARATDRRTLIRRAAFDLLGLPPTPEEVQAFVAAPEDDATAFRQLVDRLLESPHYGERWARYWLDLARFADTKGYVFFEDKHFPWAYTYRDYVINAFNQDLPYDRFIQEQLAADRLELGDDQKPLTALGFLTIGNRFMGNIHDQLDDRIDVVTRGLLGLTVTCARCHAHKYDPIPTEDYYSLYGVFRSSIEPTLPPTFLPPLKTEEAQKFETEMKDRLGKLEDFISTTRAEVMKSTRQRAGEYLLAVHAKRGQPTTEDFMLIADKGALFPVIIHRWEVFLKPTKNQTDPVWTVWNRLFDLTDAEFSQRAPTLLRELLADGATIRLNALLRASLQELLVKSSFTMKDVAECYGRVFKSIEDRWQAAIKTETPPTSFPEADAEELRQVLYASTSPANVPKLLGWGFLDLLPDRPSQDVYKKLLNAVEAQSKAGPQAPPRAHVLVDAEQPYEPVVFLRGNPHREGKQVPRAFLSLITGPNRRNFQQGSGRLELARAITDPTNPLTARVLVNRVWQHHFGNGLVRTSSDFGLRGEAPSHPALLDHLAREFVRNGWSIKQLHRAIMNSAVYQTASRHDVLVTKNTDSNSATSAQRIDVSVVDPENRWLSYFPRRRLDFEATRDALLSITGQLNRQIGGASVQVLTAFQPRRTVYGYIERLDLPILMRTFDFPDPASSSGQRAETTVAPQALFFLNDAFLSEVARRTLQRPDVASLKEPAERIQRLFQISYGRAATDIEVAAAERFLKPIESPTMNEANSTAQQWRYGYGRVDASSQRTADFTVLTHFTGTRWQASASLPDPKVGWVFLDAKGGHPAEHPDRNAIRRWIAPTTNKYSISGVLRHVPPQGNGVRARLVSSRSGVLGEWKVHKSQAETGPFDVDLQAGDTLDFVVDFNGEILHDEHEWVVQIRDHNQPERLWNSEKDFRGSPTAIDRWEILMQALVMANEFVFVD